MEYPPFDILVLSLAFHTQAIYLSTLRMNILGVSAQLLLQKSDGY